MTTARNLSILAGSVAANGSISGGGGGFTNGQSISVSNLAITGTLSASSNTGSSGQVLVSGGTSNSYWASAIPVSAYSAQFNGSNYLSIPTNAAFGLGTGDFTIECWVYPTSNPANGVGNIFDFRTGTTASALVGRITSSLQLMFYDGPGNVETAFTTRSITLNTWQHIAYVRSGNTVYGYINGLLAGSVGVTSNLGSSQPLLLGTNQSAGYSFNGYISNFRVVKGVAVYTGVFTPPTSPLGTSQAAGTNIAAVSTSQTSLLTCNGPGFTDSSPNAFTITIVSSVIASQFAPFSSFSAISRSATQTQTILTSGSGTYYPPSGVAWLRVRMVGGGGGGGGSGASYGSGTTGANTVFGSAQAYGGTGGTNVNSAATGGTGGSGTIGSFAGVIINGGQGGTGGIGNGQYVGGGNGGSSAFGGSGSGALNGAAGAAATNSGSGGGGGGGNVSSVQVGLGGGSGGYVEAYISNPAASYAYTVGAGGGGGAAGSGGLAGGGGGSGIIIVEENYAVYTGSGNYTASYVVVAGGGGGGTQSGGGGGAGGYRSSVGGELSGGGVSAANALTLIPGTTYSITVGAGGAGTPAGSGSATRPVGTNGSDSAFSTITATGGGGGGSYRPTTGLAGISGGSGGGGAIVSGSGGSGTSGQGYAGGNGGTDTNDNLDVGGGGGGAGGAGKSYNDATTSVRGDGGVGVQSSITGSATYYAGGGGGATHNGSRYGLGGSGGGGNGGNTNANGSDATVNTGGGGGSGSEWSNNGGAGGSGVVILSILTAKYSGITTGTPTVTTNGLYTIIKFTQSGSYTA